MSGPRRQHHLAQAIQRNYLEQGSTKLWWYSRKDDRYEERTSRAIAHARNTYTLPSIQGDERYAIEIALSRVEDQAAPALRKLERGEQLTQAERNAICELVAFQFVRTPSKIALVDDLLNFGAAQSVVELARELAEKTPEEFASYMEEASRHSGKKWNFDQAELVESIRNRPPKVTTTREGTLDSIVELGTDLMVEFSTRAWRIVHAPRGRSFIASNEGLFLAPGASVDRAMYGPLTKGVSVVFPFSRSAALIVSGDGPPSMEHSQTDALTIRSINDDLARISGEIFSHSRPLLESIVKRTHLDTTVYRLEVNERAVRDVVGKAMKDNKEPG